MVDWMQVIVPFAFNASILKLLILHLVLPSFKICQGKKKKFLESLNVAITNDPLVLLAALLLDLSPQDRSR